MGAPPFLARKELGMRTLSIRAAAVSLAAMAIGACTTTGFGTGQSTTGNVSATFNWTETEGTHGSMIARLSNGEAFQGQFFQITSESQVTDFGPLWNGWGPGFGWHSRFGRFGRFGWGWGGWGAWGPDEATITQYSGQVLANLQGPGGFMRCHFTLMRPSYGISGGGVGQCQLPSGLIINAQFPPGRGYF
jgi:hypothetical protein